MYCRFITYRHRFARVAPSPNQVLTHAARAAAKQPFQAPLMVAAREGLWLEQSTWLGELVKPAAV